MTTPRVLHMINGEYFGGAARVLLNYLTAERQAEVVVGLHFEGELADRLRRHGFAVELFPMRGRLDVRVARDVLRFTRSWGADLIHSHQLRNTLLARVASAFGGPPVVTHVHSPAFRESTRRIANLTTGAVDRALAGRTRRFIVVSASLARELRRLGIPQGRIRVVPNGIPLPPPADLAHRAALHAEFEIAESDQVIGMVANLRPRKGAEILMRAAALLRDEGHRLHLLFVGEAFREDGRDYAAELRNLALELRLDPRVTFTGFRRDNDRLIGGLDLFVLPSLFGEGLPMALLEAMGAGVPVISTPVEGISEVIVAGQNGLLAAVGDPHSLAASMRTLLGDREAAMAIGERGRATVEEQYSADAMARGIEAVYDELL